MRGVRISGRLSVSRNADEQDVCGEAETSEGVGGDSPGEGDFFSKDGYAYQKERKKTLHTCRKFFGIL